MLVRLETRSLSKSLLQSTRVPWSTMNARIRTVQRGLMAFVLATCFAHSAKAECSAAQIHTLTEQGKTISRIAEQCGMSKEDVQAALKPRVDGDTDDTSKGGLKHGARLSLCGCFGQIPTEKQENDTCASGYEYGVSCGGTCPTGLATGLPMKGHRTDQTHRLRRIGVKTLDGASTLGLAELNALHCAGFRNITEHMEHA